MRNLRENPAATMINAEGGQELLQVWSRSFMQHRRGPWWNRLSLCSPCTPCGAQRSPRCSSGCGLTEAAAHGEGPARSDFGPELQPTDRSLQWNMRSGKAAACGDLCWSSALLKGWPCGTEPYWSSTWRAAACEKPVQEQFEDRILWERPHMEQGQTAAMKE